MNFKEYIIQKFYAHQTGILGTIIFHLLLAIFLLSMGIARLEVPLGTEVELAALPPQELEKILEEKQQREEIRKKASAEEVQAMLRSIAVNENVREKPNKTPNVQSYIDEVMEELEADEYSGRYKARKDENYKRDSLQYDRDKKEQLLDSLKSTFYSGKSSVSYNLPERYARFLPIPVFKCEFGGRVVVKITVDRRGRVQRAEVVATESQQDDCLHDVAVDAALRSRFNEKPGAPALQTGTITYNFVKQ